MNKASHLLFGATAGAFAAVQLGASPAVGAGVGAIAGLAPDVDHPRSTLGRRLPRAYHLLTPGHRGPTHTVEWCALLGWGVFLLVRWLASIVGFDPAWADLVGWSVFAGACSHLVADLLTEQGIPATMLLVAARKLDVGFWFVRGGRIRLPRWLAIRTGGRAEPLVTTIVVTAGLITIGGWWSAVSAWVKGRMG